MLGAVFFSFFLSPSLSDGCANQGGKSYYGFGHCIVLNTFQANFEASLQKCTHLANGKLAMPVAWTLAQRMSALMESLSSSRAFIALVQQDKSQEPDGNWKWFYGDMSYDGLIPWVDNQPNDFNNEQECAMVRKDLKGVDDTECTSSRHTLCMYEDPNLKACFEVAQTDKRSAEATIVGDAGNLAGDSLSMCKRLCLANPMCFSFNLNQQTGHCIMTQDDTKWPDYQPVAAAGYNIHVKIETCPSACNGITCQNGGTCETIFDNTQYYCSCANYFEGRHCDDLSVTRAAEGCYWSENGESDAQQCTTIADNSPQACMDHIVANVSPLPQAFGLFKTTRCCWGVLSKLESDGTIYPDCTYACPGDSGAMCGGKKLVILYDYWNVYKLSQEATQCTANLCENVGKCVEKLNGFECLCVPGYQGTKCQVEINECSSNPCNHPGYTTCNDHLNYYTCSCGTGFKGIHCEIDINECLSNPCSENGVCNNLEDRWECECNAGWEGLICDTDIDECAVGQCKNGATCENGIGVYTCSCTPGWEGTDCDIDINECHSSPCVNGATCNNLENAKYTCTCAIGWEGTHCEQEINECLSNPCQHGGTCNDFLGRFTCDCVKGTLGDLCETNIDECASNPCTIRDSKAECHDAINAFSCTCSANWTNILCDLRMDTWLIASKFKDTIDLDTLDDVLSQSGTVMDSTPFIISSYNESVQAALSWDYSDIFTWCLFAGNNCDMPNDIVQWFDSTMGNCFTFNHKYVFENYSYTVNRAGMTHGLELALRAGQDDYLPWIDTAGLRIFIHNQSESINAESVGLFLIPGYVTNLAIQWNEFIRLTSPYGDCVKHKNELDYYYFRGSYSTEGCIRSCYQNELYNRVGCQDPRYPSDPKRDVCPLQKRKEINKFIQEHGDKNSWDCKAVRNCPLPCYSGMYTITQTRSVFPEVPPHCDVLEKEEDRANCSKKVHQHQILVQVYFEQSSFLVLEEKPRYPIEKLLADLGGQLGILCGISVISMAELIMALCTACVVMFTNVCL